MSYNLPGSARIREAFQRLKWAGAFGCQEVQVRKAFELVMEGSELPESRSGHQTSGSNSMVRELSLPQRGSRCCLIYDGILAIAVLSFGCSRDFPFLTGNTKPDSQQWH